MPRASLQSSELNRENISVSRSLRHIPERAGVLRVFGSPCRGFRFWRKAKKARHTKPGPRSKMPSSMSLSSVGVCTSALP